LSELQFYAFPPFSVIAMLLQKNQEEKATGTVVLPDWSTQSWYAKAMQMCLQPPICLAPGKKLLTLPGQPQEIHPLYKTLALLVSGKQYQCYLLKWVSFCQENQIKIENADINDGLKFLTYLYYKGVGYSAINTARSALSAVITLGSHQTFGEHPLVTRFLKGVFELKPSLPRYSVVWDMGIVLKHLQAMAPMEDLTLAMLTKKLTTLLALLTAQ
jgi:hypothetical protein